MEIGRSLRLARILRQGTERTVIIAIDHGNYAGAMKGIEDPRGAGIAFGRNVWHSNNPISMVKTLVQIVHEGKSTPEASLQLRETR